MSTDSAIKDFVEALKNIPDFLLIAKDDPHAPNNFRYDHIYGESDNFELRHGIDVLDKSCFWVAACGEDPRFLYVKYYETKTFDVIRTLRDSVDNNIKYELALDVYTKTGDLIGKMQGRYKIESITPYIPPCENRKNTDLLGILTHAVTFKKVS
jgi:hypothetical protein